MQPMISAFDNDNVSELVWKDMLETKTALFTGDVKNLIPLNNSSHNSKHEWWFVFPLVDWETSASLFLRN